MRDDELTGTPLWDKVIELMNDPINRTIIHNRLLGLANDEQLQDALRHLARTKKITELVRAGSTYEEAAMATQARADSEGPEQADR